jgi:hypothetical protein
MIITHSPLSRLPPSVRWGWVDDVLAVLSREQRALEQLLFRLHHVRVVLLAADERFLAMAAEELEVAAETVRELDACRAVVVDRAPATTLRSLAEFAREPASSLLHEHRASLGRLAAEVGALLESAQDLATERLAELAGARPRRRVPRRGAGDELDRAIAAAGYESVLAASTSVRLPALVSFLA